MEVYGIRGCFQYSAEQSDPRLFHRRLLGPGAKKSLHTNQSLRVGLLDEYIM